MKLIKLFERLSIAQEMLITLILALIIFFGLLWQYNFTKNTLKVLSIQCGNLYHSLEMVGWQLDII